MSEKVKLPREAVDAIVSAKLHGIEASILIRDHAITSGFAGRVGYLGVIGSIEIDTLIRALYNGYEIEDTPEEQAIHWCIKRNCIAPGYSAHDVVMAVKSILERRGAADAITS